MRRVTLLGLGLALALALAACGTPADGDQVASLSGGDATTTTKGTGDDGKDPQQQAIDFARCMREHGVDMPDPTGDGLLVRRGEGGPDPESEEFQQAEKACDHHLAELGRPEGGSGGQP